MAENKEEIASTQKILSASHDPGWNDPPSWVFSALQTPPTGPQNKRLLNKRVAFPLNAKPVTGTVTASPNLPPMVNLPPSPSQICSQLTTAPHKPLMTPTLTTDLNDDSNKVDKQKALEDSLGNFHTLLDQVDSIKKEEILKRLDRMEQMWNEDKFNSTVCKKILDISEALKAGDMEKANQLHISLVTTDAPACNSWIPGIRQLITEMFKGRS